MKWKVTIRKEFKVAAALGAVCILIAFSEGKQESWMCRNISVELDNVNENHFMDEADVLKLVNTTQAGLIGSTLNEIDLKNLEVKLKNDKHILDAELYGDLKGNLIVNVELRRPIARIVRSDAADAYVAEDGTVMSVSERYTARVVLLSGSFTNKLIEAGDVNKLEEGKELMDMIAFINEDRFWKSQVAQMNIDSDGDITIYPQVTGQRVEFGKPVDVEKKFSKLMIFYKEILPTKGWTKYEKVNLKYEGQIIAE